jgi:hypothetical protein
MFEDIGNFLSFLTVNENEREEKVMLIVNDLEPHLRDYRLRQSQTPAGVIGLNFD